MCVWLHFVCAPAWSWGSFHSKRDSKGKARTDNHCSKSCQLYTQRKAGQSFEKVKREEWCVSVCLCGKEPSFLDQQLKNFFFLLFTFFFFFCYELEEYISCRTMWSYTQQGRDWSASPGLFRGHTFCPASRLKLASKKDSFCWFCTKFTEGSDFLLHFCQHRRRTSPIQEVVWHTSSVPHSNVQIIVLHRGYVTWQS